MIALVVETRPRATGGLPEADPVAVLAYGSLAISMLLAIALLAVGDSGPNWVGGLSATLAIACTGLALGQLLLLHRRVSRG
jgi:hypothetical protein